MTIRITRFWNALDALTDAATDQREWQALLGPEYDHVSALLASTGTLARSIACPTPGGDGCPRRIVHHEDGSIRAVCGDSPKACRDLDLTREEITVLGLDRSKLARAVSRTLGLANIPSRVGRETVVQIGTHDVFAGRGFPVFMTAPGPRAGDDPAPYERVVGAPSPKLLLAPTGVSLPQAVVAALDRADVTRLALADVVPSVGEEGFAFAQSVEQLFAGLRVKVEQQVKTKSPDLAWSLPAEARWEEVIIRFISASWITVSFCGDARGFAPEELGLKNTKRQDGAPKAAWLYLRMFARTGGRLPVHHATAAETSKHQKQKQALSKALRNAFGIADEPISTEGDEYVTRFVVSADDLQQGRQDQSRGNFAGSG